MFDEALMSREFHLAFQQLRPQKREIVRRKVKLLKENPQHPSLRAHRLHQINRQIWDCYIDRGHGGTRLLYEIQSGRLLLWRLGTHDVVDHARQFVFDSSSAAQFLDWENPKDQAALPLSAEECAEWADRNMHTHVEAANAHSEEKSVPNGNCFYYFREAQLRALGVPAELVQAVKEADTLEDVLAIPGLSANTQEYLLDVATSPKMKAVLLDPSQLLYRASLDRLSGYFEGYIKKLMLNLEEDQQQYVDLRNVPLLLLKGTAGCGKTTIGIYRAIRLAEEGRRVLLVTYNKTLASVMQTLIEETIGPLPDNLEVKTAHSVMLSILGERFNMPNARQLERARQFLSEAMAEVRASENSQIFKRGEIFFTDEIQGVIKGLGLVSVEAYKAIRRYGRKTALGPAQREVVWKVYEAYQRRLDAAGLHEWSDAALMVLRQAGSEKRPVCYDDIIIDEAQDLKPVDLRVLQELVSPEGTLMVLGDAAQTLYSRGFSWVQAGISARGRTSVLRVNHRNTSQIAEAASQLIAHNTLMRSSNEYVDAQWTKRAGARPHLLASSASHKQVDLVYRCILELLDMQRYRLSDIAILCYENRACEICKQILVGNGLRAAVRTDPDFDILDNQIKILTIHSAKGLEFPVVFLMGLTESILPRALREAEPDDEEAQLEIERQRMLCYVGMTRAADLLYLVTVRGQESRFVRELAGKIEA